jgi:proteasome lid subunit RPN8/RPN11
VFVHALSGAASFAACLRLFRSYPLAVSPWSGDGRHRSIVLRHPDIEADRAGGGSDFFVLSQDQADHFVLRPWGPSGSGESSVGAYQEIRPVEPVPVAVHRVIAEGMPVPRDGTLLGWVSDRQANVAFSVYHGHPRGPWPAGPQIRAMPMVGSDPLHWPAFTVGPLEDGRLWDYLERGELVDLGPVVAAAPGNAFWVPSQNTRRAAQGHGCVVVRENLAADEFWVPAGVYMDHWMLREGVPAPPAWHLLSLPGTTDLARRTVAAQRG